MAQKSSQKKTGKLFTSISIWNSTDRHVNVNIQS